MLRCVQAAPAKRPALPAAFIQLATNTPLPTRQSLALLEAMRHSPYKLDDLAVQLVTLGHTCQGTQMHDRNILLNASLESFQMGVPMPTSACYVFSTSPAHLIAKHKPPGHSMWYPTCQTFNQSHLCNPEPLTYPLLNSDCSSRFHPCAPCLLACHPVSLKPRANVCWAAMAGR